MRAKRAVAVVAVVAGGLGAGVASAEKPRDRDGFRTAVKPYAKGVPGSGWVTQPLLSVGDVVPETGGSGAQYRMVGIPDGLGLDRAKRGRRFSRKGGPARVWMTHELSQSELSEPRVGAPRQRGAFASQYLLNRDGEVISGRRAFSRVYQDSTLVGPAADSSNATPAFSRWCSAFLAGRRVGFDRPIFFANEEQQPEARPSEGPQPPTRSFSPKGSQSVAIFEDEAHALSKLGHFPRENTLVMPGTGRRTVIVATEDGPRNTDSQLYLYIGSKDRSSRDPLRRNGLDNGKLYVLTADGPRDDENQILQGDTLRVHWAEIPDADQLTDVQTEAAADAAGAFGFVRVEDGGFSPNANRELWFNTTGDQAARPEADPHTNELGRMYRLRFDGGEPLAGATLTQTYNADQLTAAQDGPLSPDNLDITRGFVIVNEDGTSGSPPVDGTTGSRDDMDRRDRDGSIWIVPRATPGNPSTFTRVAELVGRSEGGRDNIRTIDENARRGGVWETSGIIDSSRAFGSGTFLFDVQAHAPTTPPGGRPVTVEDGQLLLLKPARGRGSAGRGERPRCRRGSCR
jgi:hypothetical protein